MKLNFQRLISLLFIGVVLASCNPDEDATCAKSEVMRWFVNGTIQMTYNGDDDGINVVSGNGEILTLEANGSFTVRLVSTFNRILFTFDSPLTEQEMSSSTGTALDDKIVANANGTPILNFTKRELVVTETDGNTTYMDTDDQIISGSLAFLVARTEAGCRYFDIRINAVFEDVLTNSQYPVEVSAYLEYPE